MKIEELSNILPQLPIEEALDLLVEKFPKKVTHIYKKVTPLDIPIEV